MKEKQDHEIDVLIEQYFAGKLNAEGLARLKEWALESEENRIYMRRQVEIWFSAGVSGDTASFDQQKAFDLFKQRVLSIEKRKKQTVKLWSKMRWVAAVILLLLLPLAYWQGKETVKEDFADLSIEAPLGARTKLFLPDGTLVWLNAGSKITYSQGFGVDDRQVKLEGEGYFEVTHNEHIPFEVNTKELNLRVLGTKFNFRNYPEDEEVVVNLLEGSVALHNGIKTMQDIYLNPEEKVILNKATGEMIKHKAAVRNSMVWTKDELFFDEELLKDIAKELMRSYDVSIEVVDSVQDRRFYGSFKTFGSSIEEVLETIASTGQMRYVYKDGKYILF